jgi:hypothetical protein
MFVKNVFISLLDLLHMIRKNSVTDRDEEYLVKIKRPLLVKDDARKTGSGYLNWAWKALVPTNPKPSGVCKKAHVTRQTDRYSRWASWIRKNLIRLSGGVSAA